MIAGARTALLTCLLICAVSATTFAQTDYVVVDLAVEGNKVATESLILGVTSIAKGSPLTSQIIQSTLQRLYGLGLFSDVRLEAEEVPGGLKVYVIVKELPKLTGLNFSGNKKLKAKDIKDKLSLGVGGYISGYLIHEARQKLLGLYAEKGYFQAKVTGTLEYNQDSTEASLTYKIDEGSKVKVEKVVVTGNQRVKADDLIGKMRNHKRGILRTSDFAKEKYQEDLEKVTEAYRKRGYIDAFLKSDSISIDTATNKMTIYLDVYEGPRYYFGNAEFLETKVIDTATLCRTLKYKQGDVFNSDKYDESLGEIYSAYQEVGHLHIRVLDERVTRSDSIIDVRYTVSEGLPSHINMVRITGNNRTKDYVIRREITSRPGQIFNRSLLIRSIREVMALNYFSKVDPIPIDLPNGDVDVEFKVEEKQTGQISAGGGYNSQDKLVGTLGMGIPNFRGNGQNLSFNVEFGSNRNSLSLSFTEPWLFGRPTLLGTDVFAVNRRWYDDYTEGQQGGSLRIGRRLRWPDTYTRFVGSVRLERYRFYDYDDTFREQNSLNETYHFQWTEVEIDTVTHLPVIVHKSQDSLVVGAPLPGSIVAYNQQWNTATQFGFTLSRDSRNLPEFATKGSIVSYSFQNTGSILGGFWRYSKHQISLAKFIPLFWKVALAAKVEYGAVIGGSDDPLDNRILVSDRFNPGGTAYDGTVRGYDDGSLTPDSVVGGSNTDLYYFDNPDSVNTRTTPADSVVTESSFTTRVRGKYMLVANAEIQVPIVEQQVYALLFFDAGNSWLHRKDIKPITGLYKGLGIGFRIAVPSIGTIGFDFAKPLDDPPTGDSRAWRPHFQIGTTIR
jgi:outer membrane protein insertion porin family